MTGGRKTVYDRFGEALPYVAQANYFFIMKLGHDLPAGVDMMTLPSMKGKDNIVSAVTESFSFASEKITWCHPIPLKK